MPYPRSGKFIYQDAYGQVYRASWDTVGGSVDFTLVVEQPYVWGEEPTGLIVDKNVYRRGVVTVTRTVIKPSTDGYEVVADGHVQYIDNVQCSFRCTDRPADPFAHHLSNGDADELEPVVLDGPRWADVSDPDAVWGDVDAHGNVTAPSGSEALSWINVWG